MSWPNDKAANGKCERLHEFASAVPPSISRGRPALFVLERYIHP